MDGLLPDNMAPEDHRCNQRIPSARSSAAGGFLESVTLYLRKALPFVCFGVPSCCIPPITIIPQKGSARHFVNRSLIVHYPTGNARSFFPRHHTIKEMAIRTHRVSDSHFYAHLSICRYSQNSADCNHTIDQFHHVFFADLFQHL